MLPVSDSGFLIGTASFVAARCAWDHRLPPQGTLVKPAISPRTSRLLRKPLTQLHALCVCCPAVVFVCVSPAYSTGACGGDITLQATNVASVRLCTALGHVTIGATLDSVRSALDVELADV